MFGFGNPAALMRTAANARVQEVTIASIRWGAPEATPSSQARE